MTTTTQTPLTCPPSAVHDMIVPWAEVGAGDLVLSRGRLRLVVVVDNSRSHAPAFVLDDGETVWRDPDSLAAVRRYDVSEG
jgi:hypothetical protein